MIHVRAVLVACLLTSIALPVQAQSGRLRVEVLSDSGPVADAEVTVDGVWMRTDERGIAVIPVAEGPVHLVVAKAGFTPVSVSAQAAARQEQHVIVRLVDLPAVEEVVTVSATRTDRRLDEVPMRVEVLGREEIEEKMLMTPGDIVMMLNEMGGLRVQATSASLGAASVRIQGMRGRYTRFLSDGLPLFGDQAGGLGLLQIPPMDLGQVEVVKGVASALYGAGAMGGVVNLISRRPADQAAHELLVNRSSRGATDAVAWIAAPLGDGWSLSLLGGGHWQERVDVDEDRWADLAGYTRGLVRPRLYWANNAGGSLFATVGVLQESRTGGTLPGAALPQTGAPYEEALETLRVDGGLVGQALLAGRVVLTARAAVTTQGHEHRFGPDRERDRHRTLFGELAMRGTADRHTWVAGVAVEHDRYRPRDLPQFRYSFTIPGVFVQDEVDLARWLAVSASGRVDRHSEYGTFLSPRVSVRARSRAWIGRLSVGTGFYGPTPITEETEAAGLSRLAVPRSLRAERGSSASFDLTRTMGPASISMTLFASRIRDPVEVDRSGRFEMVNAPQPTTSRGAEIIGAVRLPRLSLTATYTYVRAREAEGEGRSEVPLTPTHSAGVVAMLEDAGSGRLGVEAFYTGGQRLEENPYRQRSVPYVSIGVLGERRIGSRLRLFVNAENITGTRQTRWDPQLRPERGSDGRWTVDAWAPLEGRVINGGVRVLF